MNILFLYANEIIPEKGGVQRVTSVLSDYFESKGLNVYYVSFLNNGKSLDLSPRQHYLPYSNDTDKNASFLSTLIKTKGINIVINESGISPVVSAIAYQVRNNDVKLVSVINNSILSAIINFSSLYASIAQKHHLAWLLPLTNLRVIKCFLLFLYKLKYQKHYQDICSKSDRVIQLSDKFRNELNFMNAGVASNNILSIPNPVSFTTEKLNLNDKKKELLYVGRIDTVHKRVDLLLQIWSCLHLKFPDWQLKVVGGGDEFESIISLSGRLKLQRISFVGFQDPRLYYRDASIFCMTSAAESFGIVLLEAMQHGAVPFAFHSYPSVTDIIDNGENGILITPFDCKEYVKKLATLMINNNIRERIALAAHEKSKKFSIESVGNKWLKMFYDIAVPK